MVAGRSSRSWLLCSLLLLVAPLSAIGGVTATAPVAPSTMGGPGTIPESSEGWDLSDPFTPSAGTGMLDPPLAWWEGHGAEAIQTTVFTRDLPALQIWQGEHGLLLDQSVHAVGHLEPVAMPEAGLLQTRTFDLPANLAAKLVGVDGVVGVMRSLPMAEPSTPPSEALLSSLSDIGSAEPNTWFSKVTHGATSAWDRNVTGSGVRVAVADSGVDFAHPDLNGTQARVENTSSPYFGWPMAFDARSLQRWLASGSTYPSFSGSWFADTSTIDGDGDNDSELDNSGINVSGIDPSLSGDYHLGEHPDPNLRSRAGGDVDVVVVDSQVSGVYDTVYVDVDRDGRLDDEQPMRRGSETAGQDLVGSDGLWDRSAGMIYWIANNNTSLPYAEHLAARNGLANRIPGDGDLVMFMLNSASGPAGNHGTLCASAVAAQGVAGSGNVEGMAPDAKVVAVANYYVGSSFDAWRFIAEGYDGTPGTADDIQIGSFSFGYSTVVGTGADFSSLYLDWLTRVHSPTTTYLVAAGNGGHGYGTVASPGGAHGVITVGAATSHPNEAGGAVWGQSAAWSDRGPNGVGRMDPDIIAVGESATGDRTLNEVTNANNAVTTWSGTSLATPLAAGLLALVMQSWYETHGQWPDSQTLRDLVMSTADDIAHDPIVQGAGWFNASRAVDAIQGTGDGWWVEPGAWMPGQLDGAHRDANLNHLAPGGSDSLDLTLHNPTGAPLTLDVAPERLTPVSHWETVWNSSTGDGWDGAHSTTMPDLVVPLIIRGDANNTTIPANASMIRARAAMHALGFDGNQNYQTENRVALTLLRWNDTDGDGRWWNDSDGDGHVETGEWEASSEYSRITYNFNVGPQVETRIGNPWLDDGDGLLLGVHRQNVRTNQIDPLPIQVDVTAFAWTTDPWMSAPANVTLPPQSNGSLTTSLQVPLDQPPGITLHSLNLSNATGHAWRLPVVLTTSANGPFTLTPRPNDGNVSNQSLYDASWMQGAQRWGWRAESGDWKALTVDWPANLSGDGRIIIEADWPDNDHTDIDLHWFSETAHPFASDDPAAYGPHGLTYEVGSVNMDRGSGIWGHETSTGTSSEMLIADASSGTKQLLLHNVLHGVETNDLPVNLSVGMMAPLSGGLAETAADWDAANGTRTVTIGSTVDVSVNDAEAWGWSQPVTLPTEVAYQNTAGSISTSNWTYAFDATEAGRISVEMDANEPGQDLDLYLFRDADGDQQIDWGSEQEEVSGAWDSAESIVVDDPADGRWWVVVHGYDVPNGSTTFWLDLEVQQGASLSVQNVTALNASELATRYGSGSATLGGAVPLAAWDVEVAIGHPDATGRWSGSLELELASGGRIPFSWSYDLVDPEPSLRFLEPVNGTASNTTLELRLAVEDLGSGLDLERLNITMGGENASLPALEMVAFAPGGAALGVTDAWLASTGRSGNLTPGQRSENASVLAGLVVRSLTVNWTMPALDGVQAWAAHVTDREGQQNASWRTLSLDATPPSVVASSPAADHLTNASTVRLVATTESSAEVWLDGVSVLPDSLGNATMDVDLLSEGPHEFDWLVRDSAGNWNQTTTRVWRDTIAPMIDLPLVPSGWLNRSNWTLQATALDLGLRAGPNGTTGQGHVTTVWVVREADGTVANVSIVNRSDGGVGFSAGLPLAEGVDTWTVVVRDDAGNWNRTSLTLHVDRTAPNVTWPWADGAVVGVPTIRGDLVLSDASSPLLTSRLWIDGALAATSQRAPGPWPLVLDLVTAGLHEICVEVEDVTGNLHAECRDVVLDATALEPSLEAPWNGTIVRNATVPLRVWVGLDQDWSVLRWERGAWAPLAGDAGNGSWLLLDLSLQEGDNAFLVNAAVLDQTRTWRLEVTRDSLAPPLVHLLPVAATVTRASALELVAESSPGAPIQVTWSAGDSNATLTLTADEQGLVRALLDLSTTADGRIDWTWTVADDLGNTASAEAFAFVDRTPANATPLLSLAVDVITVTCGLGGEVDQWTARLEHNGTEEDRWDGDALDAAGCDTVVAAQPGNWTFVLMTADAIGNPASWTVRLSVAEPATSDTGSGTAAGEGLAAGGFDLRQVDLILLAALAGVILLVLLMLVRRGGKPAWEAGPMPSRSGSAASEPGWGMPPGGPGTLAPPPPPGYAPPPTQPGGWYDPGQTAYAGGAAAPQAHPQATWTPPAHAVHHPLDPYGQPADPAGQPAGSGFQGWQPPR